MIIFSALLYVKMVIFIRQSVIHYGEKFLFSVVKNPQKILIHRVGSFGDSIVALPAIASIRDKFPHAMIDLASTYATPLNVSTLIEDGIIDHFYLFEKSQRAQGLKQLKQEGYDLYIELPQNYGLIKSLRNMVMVRYYLKIKSAFGWDAGWVKSFATFQQRFAPPPREVDRFLTILNAHGITPLERFPVKIVETENVQKIVNMISLPLIAFVVGTNVPANKWPLSSWLELSRRLTMLGYHIVVVGGEQEFSMGEILATQNSHVTNVCGMFSLAQSAALLKNVNFAICHDTGAMHLSYAVGTPVIALFSTRQLSSKWYPPEHHSLVIQKMVECSGCFKKSCLDNICMKNISVDEIMEAVQRWR